MTETHAGPPVRADDEDRNCALQHYALLYSDEKEFLAGALPLLRTGIEAGDATFAVTSGRETEALHDALGPDASAVQFIDARDHYKNPVRALAAFSAVARTLGPRPAWLLLADDWSRHPDVIEWARYDSIVNQIFAEKDFRGFCCYNLRHVSADVIDLVRKTHTMVHEGAELRENPQYTDPASFVADIDQQPLPPSPRSASSMRVQATELHAVRAFVAEQAKRCGVTGDALHNLLVAVTEVATNAIRHGDAPVTLRTWSDDGLICEITDSGHWQPEGVITWEPPDSALESGFGLWGVGMLCDTVRVRTGKEGTAIRLRTCA